MFHKIATDVYKVLQLLKNGLYGITLLTVKQLLAKALSLTDNDGYYEVTPRFNRFFTFNRSQSDFESTIAFTLVWCFNCMEQS